MAIPYSRTIVGGLPWYSVLIVLGILAAVWLAGKEERRLGLPQDTAVDLALAAVPCGIVGARLYYVIMRWESFAADPVRVLYIWEGGIAIYGGVIGGALGLWLYARRKKLSFAALADLVAPGLLLAQAIGRWGNYFNMEAYGPQIADARLQFFPLAVLIPRNGAYVWHAATFFYESMWNFAGFAALWRIRKRQTQKGQLFAWYLLFYGSGRFVIEQLRQDSLYLGQLRVSQVVSLVVCAAAAFVLLRRAFDKGNGCFFAALACAALWMARWACLEQHALYAGLMLAAAMAAVWLARKQSHAWMLLTAALLLDATGLTLAIVPWPLAGTLGAGMHAAFCSLTLPVGVMALCGTKEAKEEPPCRLER